MSTWRDYAACQGMNTDLFYPPDGLRGKARDRWIQRAINVCAGCRVIEQCRAEAMSRPDRWGVWGGQWVESKRARDNAAPPLRACKHCNQPFTPEHGGTQYCGDECRAARNRKRVMA